MHRLSLATLLCCTALATRPAAAQTTRTGPFVTSEWLSQHLSDPNLVLLYVGTDSAYRLSHLPNSRLATMRAFAAPVDSATMMAMHDPANRMKPHPLTLELPPTARLDSALAAAGVTSRSTVVVTYEDWFTPAARILLTLEYAGLRGHAFLLDRSVSLWHSEGHPVTTEIPGAAVAGNYHATPTPVTVDVAFVKAHLSSPDVKIIDARDPEFYNATMKSGMARDGHIQGAHSIPYSVIADSAGHILPDAQLRELFTKAGVRPGDTVITYCHIGQQGSLVWAAARELGFNARLYDGSFEDWSVRPELPIEGGK